MYTTADEKSADVTLERRKVGRRYIQARAEASTLAARTSTARLVAPRASALLAWLSLSLSLLPS